MFKAVIDAEAKSRSEPSGLEWQVASVRMDDMQLWIACLQLAYDGGNVVYPDDFRTLRVIVAHEAPGTAAEFQDFAILVANDHVGIQKGIEVEPFRRRIDGNPIPS